MAQRQRALHSNNGLTGTRSAGWRIPLILIAPALWAADAPSKDGGDCATVGNIFSYCGLPNAEDLEVLPGGKGVIASDMHIVMTPTGIVGKTGTIKWLDPRTRIVTPLYPAPAAPVGKGDWGDPACAGEIGARLLPHGFHLSQRTGGAWQLLVVNHGERESVEYFELTGKGKTWSLRWRGCVVPPAPNRLNDVVGLPDGSLLVTTMHRTTDTEFKATVAHAQAGENTGILWRWTPGKGFSEEPGSASPRPNGVQVDAAGRYAYIMTAAGGGDVRKLDLGTGKTVGTISMPNPDNASWAKDGRLLVTGMTPEVNRNLCFAHPDKPCGAAFNVFAIDTNSMTAHRIFTHEGPPMGAGTVAVQYGNDLMIGTFAGDRIMAVRDLFKPGTGGTAAKP